jgi:hypothetical protein
VIKLGIFDAGSRTTSRRATILGPPARFCNILISRLIFFFLTGLSTLMMHFSSFAMFTPSKTWHCCSDSFQTSDSCHDAPLSTFLGQPSVQFHSDPEIPTVLAGCLLFAIESDFKMLVKPATNHIRAMKDQVEHSHQCKLEPLISSKFDPSQRRSRKSS